MADWRILRACAKDCSGRLEEDGQVVHQRGRHRQATDPKSGRQALPHQFQTGTQLKVFSNNIWTKFSTYERLELLRIYPGFINSMESYRNVLDRYATRKQNVEKCWPFHVRGFHGQLSSSSASFFLQTKLLTQYVLNLAKYDQNYDIRDRARFIRQLIVPTEKSGALSKYAKKLFLALKPAPVLESPFKGTAG